MMPRLPPRFLFAMLLPAMLAACTSTPNEFMRAPALSPVGSGLTPSESEQEAEHPAIRSFARLGLRRFDRSLHRTSASRMSATS